MGKKKTRKCYTKEFKLDVIQQSYLRENISELASRQMYGSPRIHRKLTEHGCQASRLCIARLMKAMGIASRIRPEWVQTTDGRHSCPVADNLLDRNFSAGEPG